MAPSVISAAPTHASAATSSVCQVLKQPVSYEQIHETVRRAVQEKSAFDNFCPTLIVAIGAGGFIPARMLRTFLKHKTGRTIPIKAIGLELYENTDLDPLVAPVRKTQWLTLTDYDSAEGIDLNGHDILIVDEVDDTRKTLCYAVAELQKDIDRQRYLLSKQQKSATWREPRVGVFVVHNKRKEKRAELPAHIMENTYVAGAELDDVWVVYPWDALEIYDHTARAEARK